MGFTQFFSGVLTIAGTLILMAVIHLGVTAVVVVLTPLSLFAAGFITRRTYRYFRDPDRHPRRADRPGGGA